jgi:Mg2+-importing ATPase
MVDTASARAEDTFDLAQAATLSTTEVLTRLSSSLQGLSSTEATRRAALYGPNALFVRQVHPTLVLFRQLRNPILLLLLGAAVVSGFTGGATNALIIAVIVALSVGLGFFNEYRAEVAMTSLRSKISQNAASHARWRDTSQVPMAELVPGDLVGLASAPSCPPTCDSYRWTNSSATRESSPESRCPSRSPPSRHRSRPPRASRMRIHGYHRPPGFGSRRRCIEPARVPHSVRSPRGLSEHQGQTAFEVGSLAVLAIPVWSSQVLTAWRSSHQRGSLRPLIEALLFSLAIAVGIAPEMMPAIVTVSLSVGVQGARREERVS